MRRTTVIALFLIANICALQWTDIQTRVDALTTLKNGKAIQPVKGFMPKGKKKNAKFKLQNAKKRSKNYGDECIFIC